MPPAGCAPCAATPILGPTVRRIIPLVCVLVLAACGTSAAGTGSRSATGPASGTTSTASGGSTSTASPTVAVACGPTGAPTLASGRHARVYVQDGTAFGCVAGVHARYALGHHGSCLMHASVAPVTIAGTLAAYGLERCGVDTGSTMVVVRRLDDGAVVRSAPATSRPGPEGYQLVGSLVLRADGATAWIASARSLGRGVSIVEVWRLSRTGVLTRLDSGGAIAVGSLRLAGSTLRWRHGTAVKSARMN